MEEKFKAGLLPYFVCEDGEVWFLFVVPSNTDNNIPEIAKGKPIGDETPRNTAIREGSEELGVSLEKLNKVEYVFCSKYKDYMLYVYTQQFKTMCSVPKSKEIKCGIWLNKSLLSVINTRHRIFVDKLIEMIHNR